MKVYLAIQLIQRKHILNETITKFAVVSGQCLKLKSNIDDTLFACTPSTILSQRRQMLEMKFLHLVLDHNAKED